MSQEQAQTDINLPEAYHKGICIDDITHLLEVEGLTISETARRLDCDPSNISHYLKRHNITPGYLKNYKTNKADILAHWQWRILNSISPDDLKKMSTAQKMMAFGILYDKERLERGGEIGVNNQSLTIVFNSLPPAVSEELQRKLLTMMQPGKGG